MIKISRPKKRGSLAISQMVVLIVGIVAIAYVAGSSLGEVSAAGSLQVGATFHLSSDNSGGSDTYTIVSTTHIHRSNGADYYYSLTHCQPSEDPSWVGWFYSTDGETTFTQKDQNAASNGEAVCMTTSFLSAAESATAPQTQSQTPSAPAPKVQNNNNDNNGGNTGPNIGGTITNTAASMAKTAGVTSAEKWLENLIAGRTKTTSPKVTSPPGYNGPVVHQPNIPKGEWTAGDVFKFIGESLLQIAAYAAAAIATYAVLDWAVNSLPGIKNHPVGEAWLKLTAAGASGVAGGGALLLVNLGLKGGLLSGISVGWALGGGAIVAMAVWALLYKQHTQKAVVFTCIPWQAPTGSSICDKCGANGLPCTAYECSSLGQNCQLLNSPQSGKQICVAVNKGSIVPPVMSFINMQPDLYSFKPITASAPSIKSTGVLVDYNPSGSGELPPYTDFQFGIQTDSASRCGISPEMIPIKDSSGSDTFRQLIPMDAGIFEYNHTFTFNSGNTSALPTQDGKMNLYIRCEDANGNIDQSYFVIQFGVSTTQLHTLPVIKATDIANNSAITSGVQSMNVTLYINKPVYGCKWSPTDRTYENMENSADCSSGRKMITQGVYPGDYQCTVTINGLTSSDSAGANNYYFRCNDTLGDVNNVNAYYLHLKGTQPLVIQSFSPNNTLIEGTSNSIPVTLQVQTFAGASGDGSAICYYNNTVGNNNYIQFGNSGTYQNSQQLSLAPGDYRFPIMCVDSANNAAFATINFSVLQDTTPPAIVRVYKDSSNVAVVTDKNATCVYDTHNCLYKFGDGISMTDISGTLHEAPWVTDRTYYIKCQDNLGVGPGPSECTSIVQASSL